MLKRVVGGVLVAAVLMLVVGGPASGVAAPAVDRESTMKAQLRDTGVYLEAWPALGDPDLWRERLERGVRRADVGVPVFVALWTAVDGIWPDQDRLDALDDAGVVRELGLPRRSVALLGTEPGFVLDEHDVPGRAGDRVDAWTTRAEAVITRIEQASPDPARYRSMTAVAQTWVYLRLAAADAPDPKRLVAELSGDVSLLEDTAESPQAHAARDDDNDVFSDPWTFVMAALVMVGAVCVFVWMTLVARRGTLAERVAAAAPQRPDPLIATLTPLALEDSVTRLAESISAADVRPGDPAYDLAQACLDAAGTYVDSERDRDRVGVHLLVIDGHAALAGEERASRCFMNPLHAADTSVRRRDVTLPCCHACAGAVRRGKQPLSLLVADEDDRVRAYYETDDVWTDTGYGAIDPRWARRALLAALGAR